MRCIRDLRAGGPVNEIEMHQDSGKYPVIGHHHRILALRTFWLKWLRDQFIGDMGRCALTDQFSYCRTALRRSLNSLMRFSDTCALTQRSEGSFRRHPIQIRIGALSAMQTSFEFWEKKYHETSTHRGGPHDLAEELSKYLRPGSTVLELGCGDGRDALYLAELHHRVIACDFSDTALGQFAEAAARLHIEQHLLDIEALPYSFADGSFDAVYARLSLHYFSTAVTRDIFAEIARMLRPSGIFLGLFNSYFDSEKGTGIRLEDRYYELASGSRKRFFTAEEAADLLGVAFHEVDSRYIEAGPHRPEKRLVRIYAERLP
jgi:SAM-dependent methyltransferase